VAGKKRWKEGRDKREPGAFLAIPKAVLHSRAYVGLSFKARALLLDIGSQFTGNNNGDLSATWTQMKRRGWKSEDTLAKAKAELLDCQLIVETRKGARPNKPSLYALTWFALDDCDRKLDMTARAYPYGAWKKLEPPLVIRALRNIQSPEKIEAVTTETVAKIA
jgi:hypothetical protein